MQATEKQEEDLQGAGWVGAGETAFMTTCMTMKVLILDEFT